MPHKLRLFSPLLVPLFLEHSHWVSMSYSMLPTSESCDTDFAGRVVYKPRVLSVSSAALMSTTAILIPAVDCVLLLHQLVIQSVTIHLIATRGEQWLNCKIWRFWLIYTDDLEKITFVSWNNDRNRHSCFLTLTRHY